MADRDEYNEKLVNEPFDIFVNADLLINQAEQLKRMNEGKRGKPYAYSDALMLIILAVKEYFGLPYRQTEGFAKCLVEYGEPGYHPIPRSAGGRRG
ncbi:MAG: transposase [Conexivisphaerales archaeon]